MSFLYQWSHYREADLQMSTASFTNNNDYEDIAKYSGSGDIYAEVGDKEFDAMFSAKIASMEDYSQYVPMASISGSLACLHRAAYPAPTIAPPTYSTVVPALRRSRNVAPPIYSAAQGGPRAVAPPTYNTLDPAAARISIDSPIYNTVIPASGTVVEGGDTTSTVSSTCNTVDSTVAQGIAESSTSATPDPTYSTVIPLAGSSSTTSPGVLARDPAYTTVIPMSANPPTASTSA